MYFCTNCFKMAEEVPLANARTVYEMARRTRVLHLPSLALTRIPKEVFSLGDVLMRLDLGFNRLKTLPPELSQLAALEQLWLNDNPFLEALPPQIELCKKLKV